MQQTDKIRVHVAMPPSSGWIECSQMFYIFVKRFHLSLSLSVLKEQC